MKPPIAFISESSKGACSAWLHHLTRVMPDERIVPFNELTSTEKTDVDVAIVADPDPLKLGEFPALKWVHSLWAGVEKMMAQLTDAPFEIVRLEDPEMARSMAEAVLAWTLYLHRDMPVYKAQQREKTWLEHETKKAGGSHVGIIGLGALGQAAASALLRQNFTVSGWSRTEKQIDNVRCHYGEAGLQNMLGLVDIVVCLIPLTPVTRGLVNTERLGWMKSGAALINFARGPVVDAQALLHALDCGHLAHAVLDVFDEEPLPQTSRFWSHSGVTVLPHISGPTNRETASVIVAENIRRYRTSGEIPKFVDRRLGY